LAQPNGPSTDHLTPLKPLISAVQYGVMAGAALTEEQAVPTIDLPDDELAAVTAAIRGVIEGDRYPHAPRLDPLRAALARFDAASKPTLPPKAPPPAKAYKRARR
jgi:hypothetical protein